MSRRCLLLLCGAQVVAAARSLISDGVSSVLVTLSERGAVLVAADGSVLTQPALPVPGGTVVDGTAAGHRSGCALTHICWVVCPCHDAVRGSASSVSYYRLGLGSWGMI